MVIWLYGYMAIWLRALRKVFYTDIHGEDTEVHGVKPLTIISLCITVTPLCDSVSKSGASRSRLMVVWVKFGKVPGIGRLEGR